MTKGVHLTISEEQKDWLERMKAEGKLTNWSQFFRTWINLNMVQGISLTDTLHSARTSHTHKKRKDVNKDVKEELSKINKQLKRHGVFRKRAKKRRGDTQ